MMTTPTIELTAAAEENGLALMLSELLRQNVADRPDKRRVLGRMLGRVAIVAEDADVALTLVFERGRVTVHDGIAGIPDLTVRADSEEITRMSLIELIRGIGLPDPRGESAREVARASKEGRIRVYGLWASLPLALRLTQVLSVH